MTDRTETSTPSKTRLNRTLSVVLYALRSTVFVVWLIGTLLTVAITATGWAIYTTWQVTQLTYRVAELTYRVTALGYQNRRAVVRAARLTYRVGELSGRVALLGYQQRRATARAARLTYRVAELSSRVALLGEQHRRALAQAIAKARVRRLIVAVPVVGAAAAVYFERQTYYEWQQLYPDGTFEDYVCDMATLTAEAIDEVLQELPSWSRPPERVVEGFLYNCTTP